MTIEERVRVHAAQEDPEGKGTVGADAMVRFPMIDRNSLVGCGVTAGALLELAAAASLEGLGIEAMFARFRAEIEAIASGKYDRSEFTGEEVIIDIGDV